MYGCCCYLKNAIFFYARDFPDMACVYIFRAPISLRAKTGQANTQQKQRHSRIANSLFSCLSVLSCLLLVWFNFQLLEGIISISVYIATYSLVAICRPFLSHHWDQQINFPSQKWLTPQLEETWRWCWNQLKI